MRKTITRWATCRLKQLQKEVFNLSSNPCATPRLYHISADYQNLESSTTFRSSQGWDSHYYLQNKLYKTTRLFRIDENRIDSWAKGCSQLCLLCYLHNTSFWVSQSSTLLPNRERDVNIAEQMLPHKVSNWKPVHRCQPRRWFEVAIPRAHPKC